MPRHICLAADGVEESGRSPLGDADRGTWTNGRRIVVVGAALLRGVESSERSAVNANGTVVVGCSTSGVVVDDPYSEEGTVGANGLVVEGNAWVGPPERAVVLGCVLVLPPPTPGTNNADDSNGGPRPRPGPGAPDARGPFAQLQLLRSGLAGSDPGQLRS